MKKTLAAALAMLLLAAPVAAQTLDTLLPTLTFPEDGVTVATKGCATSATACTTKQ